MSFQIRYRLPSNKSKYSDTPSAVLCKNTIPNVTSDTTRAYKTPSLRGAARTAPYMHAGQIKTLKMVLEHYNRAPEAPLGKTEVKPLNLNPTELDQLEAFLMSLDAPTSFLNDPFAEK